MKRFLFLLVLLPVLTMPAQAKTISWVDFQIPYE